MEFSRQRILELAAIPYSRGPSQPRDWTSSLESPALAGWFFTTNTTCCCCSVTKSCPALQSHGLQLTRLPCSSLSHGVCSNLCPLSQWCCPTISCSVTLLLLPSIFPSTRVFSIELALHIRWPNYWSFSISASNEYSGLVSFRINWFDLLAIKRTLKSLFQHHNLKASILWCSAFFMVQLLHLTWLLEKP